jgi:putative membrane protein
MVMRLTPEDGARIAAAVTIAERGTDAEIVTIVADRSDSYHDVVLHWALLAMLLPIALFAWRPGWLIRLRGVLDGGWTADYPLGELLAVLLVLLVVVFLVARLLFGCPPCGWR